MGKSSKIWYGHNFWMEGPIDLSPTRLNSILQDLLRDTLFDHIWLAQGGGGQVKITLCMKYIRS